MLICYVSGSVHNLLFYFTLNSVIPLPKNTVLKPSYAWYITSFFDFPCCLEVLSQLCPRSKSAEYECSITDIISLNVWYESYVCVHDMSCMCLVCQLVFLEDGIFQYFQTEIASFLRAGLLTLL